MNYADISKEETLKARVFADFFGTADYAYEPNISNIDFVVTAKETRNGSLFPNHYLWAEAKRHPTDAAEMFTQLLPSCL